MSDATDRLRAIAQAGELLGLDEVEAMLDAVELLDQARLHIPHGTYLRQDCDDVLARFREVADE